MATLKKKDVKFCPVCGAKVEPEPKGPNSTCGSCGLVFFIIHIPEPTKPKPDGHSFLNECGNGVDRKRGGKIGYDSVEAAFEKSLTLGDLPPHRMVKKLNFYQCRWCNKFHFGHKGKRSMSKQVYTYAEAKTLYERKLTCLMPSEGRKPSELEAR